ncbi:uncharacterized protein [Typha angustifolia]|uniref:uncharacterized protein n=1 Tax=Typha angustifolia TaxID=59011 RepID=UPI003C307CE7
MDDSCAVCAETLEWVAYGSCGHREVCSTCVARLRFVLDDRRCCICKTECPTVFVTKALGDYTRVISDFSVFPAGANEGQVGSHWYHEDTQAYIDDVDHYKMIRAMCRLSCSVCDNSTEEQGSGAPKRRSRFRSIEQLKGHLFHQHRLFMCSLCLEGRKVFICEQKLYNRSQLTQHISTGDSEVDGTESERGGFAGHPMCEFCKNPFYGDNELYMHMSTEHFTCHLCQRQHPGQYDYYRNYDDLEMHFRQEHFLCEDEACLAKKFIVFQSEAEMKRHNAIEHGGNMSRSKRNAALQIPTSFRYRRTEQEHRRGRGRGFRPDTSSNQLAMAIEASLETAMANGRVRDSSSTARAIESGEVNQRDIVTGSLDSLNINSGSEAPSRSLATQNQSSRSATILEESSFPPLLDREIPEPSARYAQALTQNSRSASRLGEDSFPPLPGANKKNKPKVQQGLEGLAKNTLAARLQQRSKGSITINSARSRPSVNHKLVPSSSGTSSQIWPTPNQGLPSSSNSQHRVIQPARENGFVSPPSANTAWSASSSNRMRHSASAPNLIEKGSSNQAAANTASIASRSQVLPTSRQSAPNVEDVRTANKSLVERIRAALGMDEDRYTTFKSISAEYRQGQINTWEYLSYVEQFGLSHLILELARLLPDVNRQKELTDAYHANLRFKDLQQNAGSSPGRSREGNPKKKGKGKVVHNAETSTPKDALTDNILETVRKLQSGYKPQEGNVEVLSKDGYRAAKEKLQISAGESHSNPSSLSINTAGPSGNRERESLLDGTGANQNLGFEGSSKQRKKTAKFLRVRLGDGSAAALLDLGRPNASPEQLEQESANNPSEGLPIRGVWRNGGGQRLFSNTQRNPSN